MGRLSRRQFLRQAAATAAGIELGRHLAAPGTAAAAPAGDWPLAAVSQGTNADSPAAILKTALDAIGGIGRFVKPGQVVAIKPNVTWDYPPHTASSTDPDLLRALIMLVKEAGAKRIIVLDHPTISPAADCLEVSGIGKLLDGLPVEKVFPDRTLAPQDTYVTIDLPGGKSYQKMSVLKAAVDADVRINLAVAKSHVVLPVTLCLKHMMGFLASPPGLHADLEQGLIDLNGKSAIQVQLHILEALRVRLRGMAAGYETDLTNPNLVKRYNQVIAGTDPVLIDSYACINYFGRQPKEIRYVKMAGDAGLGETDVKKATTDGRLRVFKAGAPVAAATATPTATSTATAGASGAAAAPAAAAASVTPSPTGPAATATPLPTATFDPAALTPPAPAGAVVPPGQRNSDALSPNRFLSGALIPAAAIVTGAGLVIGRRLQHAGDAAAGLAPVPPAAPTPAEPTAAPSAPPPAAATAAEAAPAVAPATAAGASQEGTGAGIAGASVSAPGTPQGVPAASEDAPHASPAAAEPAPAAESAPAAPSGEPDATAAATAVEPSREATAGLAPEAAPAATASVASSAEPPLAIPPRNAALAEPDDAPSGEARAAAEDMEYPDGR